MSGWLTKHAWESDRSQRLRSPQRRYGYTLVEMLVVIFLMTTVMLVAAMIPMALGEGPGAAARAGMAKVILGGQLLSLLLTLLVTPVAYSLWDDLTTLTRRVAIAMSPRVTLVSGGSRTSGLGYSFGALTSKPR